jgi:hypothetical protein
MFRRVVLTAETTDFYAVLPMKKANDATQNLLATCY